MLPSLWRTRPRSAKTVMMRPISIGSSSSEKRRTVRPHQALNATYRVEQAGGIDAADVAEQARDQRRQREEVQHVVAEVAEQRLRFGHAQEVAQRMRGMRSTMARCSASAMISAGVIRQGMRRTE